jgi:hypothetical protein
MKSKYYYIIISAIVVILGISVGVQAMISTRNSVERTTRDDEGDKQEPEERSMVVADPSHIDLTSEPGKLINTTFMIRNMSDEEVTILKIKESCGCTAAHIDHRVLHAKEAVPLNVSYTPSSTGTVTHGVLVSTSVGDIRVTFSVTSKRPIEIDPYRLDFGTVLQGQKIVRMVKISSTDDQPFSINAINSSTPNVTYTSHSQDLSSSSTYFLLNVSLDTPPLCGLNNASINIVTNHASIRTISLPISWFTSNNSSVTPNTLFLNGNVGEVISTQFIIRPITLSGSLPKNDLIGSGSPIDMTPIIVCEASSTSFKIKSYHAMKSGTSYRVNMDTINLSSCLSRMC